MTENLPFETENYITVKERWPPEGRHIIASYTAENIVVYQAYNSRIASALVAAQNFHSPSVLQVPGYNKSRMSWIKTNFLWMMFRSNWGSKPNQQETLAITLTRNGFDFLLSAADTKTGSVRLQWDPDHSPTGGKITERRDIQLGLSEEARDILSHKYIVRIDNISMFVETQRKNVLTPDLLIPLEKIYTPNSENLSSLNLSPVKQTKRQHAHTYHNE